MFIAPSPPAYQAPVIPVQPQNEEKTLVYVLVKKPEEQQDIVIPTAAPTQPSKPEVIICWTIYFHRLYSKYEQNVLNGFLFLLYRFTLSNTRLKKNLAQAVIQQLVQLEVEAHQVKFVETNILRIIIVKWWNFLESIAIKNISFRL